MSSTPPESEPSELSRSWVPPLAVAAGVVILVLGLYRANTDHSEANDLDESPAEASAQEAAPATSAETSDPARARTLERARSNSQKIDEDSEQFLNRVALIELFLDYSDEARARRHELILWFLRNHPEDEVLPVFGELYPGDDDTMDGKAWTAAVAILDSLVAKDDVLAGVLANYAAWTSVPEPSKALELYGRLQDLEPDNPEWLSKEADLYMLDILHSKLGDPDARSVASLAKEAITTALEHSEGLARGGLLADGIEAAALAGDADTAEAWARDLLEPAGNDGASNHARHIAHQGMGLAALVRGDTDGAVAELLQMGDVPPDAVQMSFGPSMRLANELLARGEREAVIQYLEKVSAFWEPEGVAAWIQGLRAGETFRLDQHRIGR